MSSITTDQRRQAHLQGQCTDNANFQAFTATLPELVTLQQFGWAGGSADIAGPLQAAINYLAANAGGVVKLPGGNLFCSKRIVVPYVTNAAASITTGITIEGAGCISTIILFTATVTEGFHFNPSPAAQNARGGGIRDLTIIANGGSSTGTGIRFGECLLMAVENVAVYGFQGSGGIGVKFGDADVNASYICQQMHISNLYVSTSETGVLINGLNQGTFVGLKLDQNTLNCLKIANGVFSIEGMLMQGAYTNGVLLAPLSQGGIVVNIGGYCYVETNTNKPVVKVTDSSTNNGTVLFSANLTINDDASAGPIFDLAHCTFVLQGVPDLRKAHPWIKGRNMKGLTVHNLDVNGIATADLFDLDAASEAVLNFVGFGVGSLGKIPQGQPAQLLGVPLQTARVNIASENTSVYGGAVVYSPDVTPAASPSVAGALRVFTESGYYRTVSFDPDSWYSILAPFASTGGLWWADSGVTNVGGKASAWAGQVHGYTYSQGTAGNRPTIATATGFNNKTVLRFARASSTFMSTGDVGTDIVAATNLYPYLALLISFTNYIPDPGYEQDPIQGYNTGQSRMPLQVRLLGAQTQGRTSRNGIFVPGTNISVPNATALLLEIWTDSGTGTSKAALNYSTTYTAGGSAFPNDTAYRQLFIGGPDNSGTFNTDMDIRGIAVLPAKPPDTVRQALHAFCVIDSGIS